MSKTVQPPRSGRKVDPIWALREEAKRRFGPALAAKFRSMIPKPQLEAWLVVRDAHSTLDVYLARLERLRDATSQGVRVKLERAIDRLQSSHRSLIHEARSALLGDLPQAPHSPPGTWAIRALAAVIEREDSEGPSELRTMLELRPNGFSNRDLALVLACVVDAWEGWSLGMTEAAAVERASRAIDQDRRRERARLESERAAETARVERLRKLYGDDADSREREALGVRLVRAGSAPASVWEDPHAPVGQRPLQPDLRAMPLEELRVEVERHERRMR